jgi:Na+/H+ antiporter NhaD/arsenite permease-like protein
MRLSRRALLILLASFAAHVGAAFFPFGTPQNLFIYFHFQPGLGPFLQAIAPFVLGMGLLLLAAAALSGIRPLSEMRRVPQTPMNRLRALLYSLFFLLLVLAVIDVLPWGIVALPLLYAWLFDPPSLRVDYYLLLTFAVFLALAANVSQWIGPLLHRPHHLFLLAAVMSQFLSNVPTALLLQPLTSHWQALLWGTNVGGFGTPVAALANLILLRLYRQEHGSVDAAFWRLFLLGNLLALGAGVGLYLLIYGVP